MSNMLNATTTWDTPLTIPTIVLIAFSPLFNSYSFAFEVIITEEIGEIQYLNKEDHR